MVSKTIFRLIDGLILCANKLCGIDTITFEGEENDFLSYLLFSEEIGFAFRVTAILAAMLLVVFSVFVIVKSIAKEKVEGTAAQIAMKSFKTLLMFFFVPVVMIAFMTIGNAFVQALYGATAQASSTPGAFLFSAFAADGGMNPDVAEMFKTGEMDYNNTDLVSSYMTLSNFPFIFSWLAGGVTLFSIASAMLIFIDRVLSIVILYVASPISISTCLIDDGARFKLWRDQFLTKFIMGYGMIIAINIYALVCGLVMKQSFSFFSDNAFLDLIMKLLIIGGGALTLQKSMALIGNLVSSGAGSNELRDNALTAGKLAKMAMGGVKGVAGTSLGLLGTVTGAKAAKSVVSDAISMKSRDLGSRLLDALHLGTGDKKGDKDEKSDSQNNEKANYGSDKNAAKDAISNPGFKTSDWGSNKGNSNNNQPKQQGEKMVNNAINGDKMEDKKKDNKENGGEKDK